MTKKLFWVLMLGIVLLIGLSVSGSSKQEVTLKFSLLIVDETKTFTSSMRVGITANILKKLGLFAITADMVDVSSSYVDPLAGKTPPSQPYDIVVIFPRGIDNGSVDQIWVITRDLSTLSPHAVAAVTMLETVVNKMFTGVGTPTDVNADLFPGLLSALYVKEGWL